MQNPILAKLDLVEQQFDQVAAFLADGNAEQLQTASDSLQSLSVELAKLMQTSQTSPALQTALRQRVRTMAAGMQMLRENLSRRAAYTEQALAVVIPSTKKSTYSAGTSVYGTVGRQSGQIKFLAA